MIRILLSLLLALTLAATSVSAAVMQSEMQGAQQMLICSDSDASAGLTTITLDATGKPIASAHHCSDCTVAAALRPDLTHLAPHTAATRPPHPLPVRNSTSITPPPQSARDPPPLA